MNRRSRSGVGLMICRLVILRVGVAGYPACCLRSSRARRVGVEINRREGSARAGRTAPRVAARARIAGYAARATLSSGQPSRDVQQPVAQRLRLGLGQICRAGAAAGSRPVQVDGSMTTPQARNVRGTGKWVEASVFPQRISGLDPGFAARGSCVRGGRVAELGVGGERGC